MLAISLLVLFTSVMAIDITVNPALDAALFTAPTQLDRLKQLPSNSDWVFDFNVSEQLFRELPLETSRNTDSSESLLTLHVAQAQPSYTYSPGSVINANAATFPATVGNGMTLAMLNLGPCAMLPPHYHPRATNLVSLHLAVSGASTDRPLGCCHRR